MLEGTIFLKIALKSENDIKKAKKNKNVEQRNFQLLTETDKLTYNTVLYIFHIFYIYIIPIDECFEWKILYYKLIFNNFRSCKKKNKRIFAQQQKKSKKSSSFELENWEEKEETFSICVVVIKTVVSLIRDPY